MEKTRLRRFLKGTMLVGVAAILLAGCDYWPPALQAQIEQLRSEAKQAAAERAALEEQLNTATRLQSDLHAKVEELTRTNQELSARVGSLDQALIAERQKMARMIEAAKKGAPTAGGKPKATAKPATKAAAKKKSAKTKAAGTSVSTSGKTHRSGPGVR